MTREELYRLVWQKPAVHVARQLGLANGTFRSLCATYNIPLPPAGYWTQRAHGKGPQPVPLPDTAPKLVRKINLALLRIGETAIDIADAQIADYSLPELTSGTPPRLPIVDDIAARLRDATADAQGFVTLDVPELLLLDVAAADVARAAAFLATFFATAATLGFAVPDALAGRFAFGGETFATRLYGVRPKEGGSDAAAGRLCLEIYDPRPLQWQSRNLIGHWHDRKERPLEGLIRMALAAAVNAAPLIRQAREAAIDTRQAARVKESPAAQDVRELLALREMLRRQAQNKALTPRMWSLLVGLLAELDAQAGEDEAS